MFYKYNQWDPKLIIGQIISIQCLYYILFAGSLYILDSIFLEQLTLEQMFSYKAMNAHTLYGKIAIAGVLINSLFGSICLKYIVERSKKCLDHSGTVTVIHLIIVSLFSGFPKTLAWWSVHLIGLVLMAMFGEYLCMRKELMDIPLSRGKEVDSTPLTLNPILSSTIAYNQSLRNNQNLLNINPTSNNNSASNSNNNSSNNLVNLNISNSTITPSSSSPSLNSPFITNLNDSSSSVENDPISILGDSSSNINLSTFNKYQPLEIEIISNNGATSSGNSIINQKRNYSD